MWSDDLVFLKYDGKAHEDIGRGTLKEVMRSVDEAEGWRHRSVFGYDQSKIVDHFRRCTEHGRTTEGGAPVMAGYSDYGPKDRHHAPVVPIDVDYDSLLFAANKTKRFCEWLDDKGVPFYLWFSGGKGYHIEIHQMTIGYRPHTELPGRMRWFVRELVDRYEEETGQSIAWDDSIYSRNSKIRLPNCARTFDGKIRRKVWLNVRSIGASWDDALVPTYQWGKVQSRRKMPVPTYNPREDFPDVSDPRNAFVAELWDEWEPRRDLVEVHHNSGGEHRTYGNIDDVIREIESESMSERVTDADGTEMIRCRCPNPHHDDWNPSAAVWVESGTGHCFKCGSMSPAEVASYVDVELEEVDEEEEDDHTELAEARKELAEGMSRAMDEGGVHLFTVPVGVGKSYTARRAAENNDKWLYMVDDHELGREVQEDLRGSIHLRSPWMDESRCISEPMDDRGEMPTRKDEIQHRLDRGEPASSVCATCPLNPDSDAFDPSREPCKWREKRDRLEGQDDHGVVAKAYLRFPTALREKMRTRKGMIVDEDPMDDLIPVYNFRLDDLRPLLEVDRKVPLNDGAVRTERMDEAEPTDDTTTVNMPERRAKNSSGMPLHYVNTTVPLPGHRTQSIKLGSLVRPILEDGVLPTHQHVTDETGSVLGQTFRTEEYTEDDPVGWRPTETVMDYVDAEGFVGLEEMEILDECTRFLNVLLSKSLMEATITKDSDGIERLLLKGYNDLEEFDNVILLDASVGEVGKEVYRGIFDDLKIHEIECVNKDTQVVHDPSSTWSRSAKERQKQRHDSGGEEFDRFQRLKTFVRRQTREYGKENVGIISHKECPVIGRLMDALALPDDAYMWYGNLKGKDRFKPKECLIVVGDPSVNGFAYELEKFRWGMNGHVSNITTFGSPWTSPDGSYTLRYDTVHPLTTPNQGLDFPEWIYKKIIRDPIYQAIGRIRGIEHDSTVYYFGSPWPGQHTVDQFDYIVDPDLLHDNHQVYDPVDLRTAEIMVNQSMMSLSEISRQTGLSRGFLRSMKNDAQRDRKSEIIEWLYKDEGMTQKEVAEELDVSPRTVRNHLKS